jgi:uncharacterized protein
MTTPMIAPIWKQLPSGRMVDLMDPTPSDIDFSGDVAPALAYLARFDGACTGPLKIAGVRDPVTAPWTVLDHSVDGADLLRAEGHPERMGALFLLHDAHEAFVGDIASPVAAALAATASREFPRKEGYPAGHYITCAIGSLKHAWDKAIHAAAGVAMPTPAEAAIIKRHDLRMLVTERNHMMAQPWRSWGPLETMPPLRMTGRLKPGPAEQRITTFLSRLDAWAPNARPRATPAALASLAPIPSAKGARA